MISLRIQGRVLESFLHKEQMMDEDTSNQNHHLSTDDSHQLTTEWSQHSDITVLLTLFLSFLC